jgi:hypothetical protein
MDYLGLFCLGVFVGTIATFGMNKVTQLSEWKTVMTLTLPAVLSGAAMVFIDRFKYSPAFGCYPLGLAVALTWAYTARSLENIRAGGWLRGAGVLHLLASALLTFAGIVVAAYPAVLQLAAEKEISSSQRKEELLRFLEASRQDAEQARRSAGAAAAPASHAASPSTAGH